MNELIIAKEMLTGIFKETLPQGESRTPVFFMDHYLNLLKKPIAAVSSSPSEKIA